MGVFYVFLTVFFTVYGQLVLRWQVGRAGALPDELAGKLLFLAKLLANPWVLSGFASAFLASLAWMAALTKFPLNVAYPFMSLSFVSVLLLGAVLFGEAINPAQWAGMALLVLGLVVGSQRW
jgi:multidrug transporter EmrE-like cation transporter